MNSNSGAPLTVQTGGPPGSYTSRRNDSPTSIDSGQMSIMHTFKTLRHFNELRKSINRAEIDTHAQIFPTDRNELDKPIRKLQYSSAHKLRNFSHSVYDDLSEVKTFRQNLLDVRARQRANQLAATHSSLNLENITGRPGSPTGGSFASLSPGSPGGLASSSSYVFNGDPLTSAKTKLTKYSLSFDPLEPNNQRVISGFHGQRLSRESFSLLIRQGLHISLSSNEVDALYNTMDISPDHTFDGKEFTQKFFNLGNDARRDTNMNASRGGGSPRRSSPTRQTNLEREKDM
jgi:hypothetical protein